MNKKISPENKLPDLSRTAKAIEEFDRLDSALAASIPVLSHEMADAAWKALAKAEREVGRAYGQDTMDRNNPKTCEECILPGRKVPLAGGELSFVRRMVNLWRKG